MSRYWFYLFIAICFYAMMVWIYHVLVQVERRPTRAFRWRLRGWLLLLTVPSLWLTFRVDRLFPALTPAINCAMLVILMAAFLFTVMSGLGYVGFLGQRFWRLMRPLPPLSTEPPVHPAPVAPTIVAAIPAVAGVTAPAAPTGPAAESKPASEKFPLNPVQLERRRWLQRACYGYVGLIGLTTVGAVWTQAVGLQVHRTTIHCPRLPRAFRGYRILQISDLHTGVYMDAAQLRLIREAAEQQRADLIVFTGDQVDRRPHELAPFLSAFNGIAAADGVYGIMGNHDYIAGGRHVLEGSQAGGIPMLVNRSVRLRRGEQSLALGGLDDLWHGTEGPDIPKTFADTTTADFKLCLAHNPNCWDETARAGIDLTLSGHTHGGQINLLSDSFSPARLLSPYVRGRFERDQTQLFVSVGAGCVGIPVRIGVPAEIVVITLT